MKKNVTTTLKWVVSVFFLLSALIYFPSAASIFMAILGVFLLPVSPIQNIIKQFIKQKWLRILITVVLFVFAMSFVPTEPDAPTLNTPSLITEPTISETTDNTTETEEPENTTDTTEEATTEATQPPATVPPAGSSFEVHFIDVGQADSALVLCDGNAMLIDGGNVEDSSKLYTYLKKHNISYLNYVIGTHAHEDHIGGLAGALNYASVGVVYSPVTSYDSAAFQNFVKAVGKHNVSITVPSVGTNFSLGSASCKILAVNTGSDTNNSSIVLRITYGETSFLFTGDAETEVEQAILNRGEAIASTVLKVGHHGSETSSGYVWLREVMPKYAVISVGDRNSYGHPTEAVLSRLRDADITTYRTDMQGDIICRSDGHTITVSVSRNANADVFGGIGGNSTQKPIIPEETKQPTEPQETSPKKEEPPKETESNNTQEDTLYILNTNTKKFHYPHCHSAKKIKDENRSEFNGTREELIAMGYSPCGNCDP